MKRGGKIIGKFPPERNQANARLHDFERSFSFTPWIF
jgi:hypothetical protein